MLGKITAITGVEDYKIQPIAASNEANLGMSQMLNAMMGFQSMDGYKIETDEHIFHVLIDNGQSCCESWGYFTSEDGDLDRFIGATLSEIKLTDTALNVKKFEESDYYEDGGGIQFVDFETSIGTFQLAVYNAHNGYYGHGILVAKDSEILLNDTL